MERTGTLRYDYLLSKTMRNDGFLGIHGSPHSQSHQEGSHHGDGLALKDCVGSHCVPSSSSCFPTKRVVLAVNFRLVLNKFTSPGTHSVFISCFQEGFLCLSGMYLRSSKCRGVSEGTAKQYIGVSEMAGVDGVLSREFWPMAVYIEKDRSRVALILAL